MTTYILTFYNSLRVGDRYRMRDENGTAIPDADLETIFGSDGKARFILDWDGKTSSDPSQIQIRNSGNTVVISYTAQKALLPAQLYEGTWTGGASTFTSFTPVEGKTLSEDQLSFLMEQIKSTQSGGIKTLTTADYNYPTSGTKTQVALWLLEPGIYKSKTSGSSLQITPVAGTNETLDAEEIIIITKAGSNSILSIYPYNHSYYKGLKMFVADSSTGAKKSLSGFNNSILTTGSVYDNLNSTDTFLPLSANMGRFLKEYIDSLVIKNAGAPTTSTVGIVGQLYEDGTNGALYQLKSIDTSVTPNSYNWEQVGGSSVNIVQTTGTSTTDVMSQDATTKMVFDTGNYNQISIGGTNNGNNKIWIGNSLARNHSLGTIGIDGILIGKFGSTTGAPNIGQSSIVISQDAWNVSARGAVVLGNSTSGNYQGSILLGYGSSVSSIGEMNIGSSSTSYGYNSSNYRLLTGLYDPQSAHDAATKGYVDGLVGNVESALNVINNGTGA